MKYIIIGNILALIGSLLMVYAGYIKEKKQILITQIIHYGLFLISNLFLNGITGAIANLSNIIQNTICYKNKFNLNIKIVLTILVTILSLTLNNLGLIGLLPLIITISYIWLMNIKNIIKFKLLIIFTLAMWIIYSIEIKAYTAIFFNIASILSNMISIYQLKNKPKEKIQS